MLARFTLSAPYCALELKQYLNTGCGLRHLIVFPTDLYL